MKKLNLSAESIEPFFNKIGELTKIQRYIIYCGTIIAIVIAFVFLSYLPKKEDIKKLNKEKKKVEEQLKAAKAKASQLEARRKEMESAKAEFEIVKKTLPEKKEIPSLLASISEAGRDAGLEFSLFRPNNEVSKNFYAEIPISLSITGNYHNVAMFFDKVARLSRIVNIENISISGSSKAGLSTSCVAVTYRFLESSQTGKKKKKK